MCLLARDLLFLGSRIGDSLLVKFTPKEEPAAPLMLPDAEDEEEVEEKTKGKRSKSKR